MKESLVHRPEAFGVFLFFAMILCGSDALRAQSPHPYSALILVDEHFKLDPTIRQRLAEAGFAAVERKLSEPLSDEQLRLFQVVILPNFRGLQTPFFVPREFVVHYLNAKRNIERLHRYVKDGGGLFFSPRVAEAGDQVAEGSRILLEPWGVKLLGSQVRDEAHAGCEGEYAWTTRVLPSPVSEGVQRLWYPTNMLRWDDAYATVAFVPEAKEWQPAVTGMPGSVLARGLQYTAWIPLEGQTTPVIAAVRNAGKGRVALLSVGDFYTFSLPFAAPANGWVGESHTGRIAGIFLEKGDGNAPSDGWRLMLNMLHWLAEKSKAEGFGGWSEERFDAAAKAESEAVPGWLTWWEKSGAMPIKVLMGARTQLSDGKGTVADFAAAARKAGYGILVFTETFEHLSRDAWRQLVEQCDSVTQNGFVALPGIDIADVYQNRFIVFGQRIYPDTFMLSKDGRALEQAQYLSLGFGEHFTAIHRPTTTPLVHQLYKFFSGLVIYTYRNGEIVDNGFPAWEEQVNNASVPAPLVVHEVFAPEEIEKAAAGHQLYVMADSPANAAWYMRAGMAHFWEEPNLFLVSSGPMLDRVSPGSAILRDEAPITEVRLISQHYEERLWRPNAQQMTLEWRLPASRLRWCFLHIKNEKGQTAITPPFRVGHPGIRYSWRCSDRQNFFGYAMNYTGTTLPDVDISMPVFGTDEGRGLWPTPHGPKRGENLAPLLQFPYTSPAVYVTEAVINQRYWRANWLDVVFDAKAAQGTSRSRIYEGRIRYYDFGFSEEFREKDPKRPMMIKEIQLTLRRPLSPEGAVFPTFTHVSPNPEYAYLDTAGQRVQGTLDKGFLDLPAGGYVDDLIALSPLRIAGHGPVGFAAPDFNNGPLPTGTTWSASYVRVPKDKLALMHKAMGLDGATPFKLALQQGLLDRLAYVAHLKADRFGVAGTVEPWPEMPYRLPLFIEGVNAHWDAAVWQTGAELDRFGVFEGRGMARLDVTRPGPFYAGNIILAGDRNLRLTVVSWTKDEITLEAHNPTVSAIQTTLETPPAIADLFPLKTELGIPAGNSIVKTIKKQIPP